MKILNDILKNKTDFATNIGLALLNFIGFIALGWVSFQYSLFLIALDFSSISTILLTTFTFGSLFIMFNYKACLKYEKPVSFTKFRFSKGAFILSMVFLMFAVIFGISLFAYGKMIHFEGISVFYNPLIVLLPPLILGSVYFFMSFKFYKEPKKVSREFLEILETMQYLKLNKN